MTTSNATGARMADCLRVESGCDLAALRATTMTVPRAAAGHVLVQVQAAAVNRSDLLNVRGLIPFTVFPRVPGRDFAGTVVEGPEHLLGTLVWGCGGGDLGFAVDGSHSQFLCIPEDAAIPAPSAWNAAQAGAGGLAYATGALALRRAGRVDEGATVVVTGAVGGVGAAVSALAAAQGARVIGAVRGSREVAEAAAAGIEVVIDTAAQDLTEAVLDATGGAGADRAVDTVGVPVLNAVMAAMGVDGSVCLITAPGPSRADFDTLDFYRKDLTLTGLNTTRFTVTQLAQVLQSLGEGFSSGTLPAPRISATYPLAEVAAAYLATASGELLGRVVLEPWS